MNALYCSHPCHLRLSSPLPPVVPCHALAKKAKTLFYLISREREKTCANEEFAVVSVSLSCYSRPDMVWGLTGHETARLMQVVK